MEDQSLPSAGKYGSHPATQKSSQSAQLAKNFTKNWATVETPNTIIQPLDRCDRCIQKAVYMVVFNAGDLYFCRHHFQEHEDTFINTALDIYDDTDTVLIPAGASDIQ